MEKEHVLPENESDTIEFKSSFSVAVIETLVAFANTKGGAVYVGVNDSGKVTGATLSKESLQQWVNVIKSKTEPSLMPDIDIIEIDDKQVVIIHIIEYPVKPLSIQGRYYRRISNSNHLMTASEVSDCFLQSMQYSWIHIFIKMLHLMLWIQIVSKSLSIGLTKKDEYIWKEATLKSYEN